MPYPSSRVCVYDLSLVSLRLRGTRSRNKRTCLLRFESADLSYLSLRRTPVVVTMRRHAGVERSCSRCIVSTRDSMFAPEPASRPGREKTHLHRSPVVADLASPRRSIPPGTRKGVIGRMWRCFGWGCLLVILGAEMSGGRGLQKSRWRVRFGCIVATHLPRDKIAGWVTLGAGVPPALSRPHTARDRGCGRCNSEDRRQQVGIFSKFRQVSEITKDRLHIVDFPADLLAGIVLIGCRRDPRLYARCEGAVSSPPGPCLVPLRSPIRAGLGTRSGSSRG